MKRVFCPECDNHYHKDCCHRTMHLFEPCVTFSSEAVKQEFIGRSMKLQQQNN